MAFDTSPTRASTAHKPMGAFEAEDTSKELLGEYGERLRLFVYNTGEKDVWLALGGEKAEVKKGIPLPAKTGKEVIEGFGGAIHCITTEGKSLLTYSEL